MYYLAVFAEKICSFHVVDYCLNIWKIQVLQTEITQNSKDSNDFLIGIKHFVNLIDISLTHLR